MTHLFSQVFAVLALLDTTMLPYHAAPPPVIHTMITTRREQHPRPQQQPQQQALVVPNAPGFNPYQRVQQIIHGTSSSTIPCGVVQ